MRVVDMVTPIGKGHAADRHPRRRQDDPPAEDRQQLLENDPDAYVMVLLIDERPEEVTEMERSVKGPTAEVISSTFDEPASRTSRSPRWCWRRPSGWSNTALTC